MAEGHLSRKLEMFNSFILEYEVTGDILGWEFGFENENFTGVYSKIFPEDGFGKRLLDRRVSLPCPEHANSLSTALVVECNNQVCHFSEQEFGHTGVRTIQSQGKEEGKILSLPVE